MHLSVQIHVYQCVGVIHVTVYVFLCFFIVLQGVTESFGLKFGGVNLWRDFDWLLTVLIMVKILKKNVDFNYDNCLLNITTVCCLWRC